MDIAFSATLKARSCGVETTAAPVRGILWQRLSWTSPVLILAAPQLAALARLTAAFDFLDKAEALLG